MKVLSPNPAWRGAFAFSETAQRSRRRRPPKELPRDQEVGAKHGDAIFLSIGGRGEGLPSNQFYWRVMLADDLDAAEPEGPT